MQFKGISKYAFGPNIILGQNSFTGAQKKIEEIKKKYYNKQNICYFYYNKKNVLWKETQFLFLCTFVEFRLSELVGYLYRKNLIKINYISELNKKYKNKIPRSKKLSINDRIFSPRGLLEILKYNLGNFIKIIEEETKNFRNKKVLIKELNDFKKNRNDFIHHSFSSNKDVDLIMANGIKRGKQLMRLFDSYN